jgi:hypothetical protein
LTTAFDFFLELIAVFLGVLAAFELDKYRESKAEDKERLRLLELIYREVTSDKGILDGMLNIEMESDISVPNARPMRNIWDGITSKLAILRHNDLLEEATMLYWELANLDKMLDIYRYYAGVYQYAGSEERMKMRDNLLNQRIHYVEYIKKEPLPQIATVINLIEAELREESASGTSPRNTKINHSTKQQSNQDP